MYYLNSASQNYIRNINIDNNDNLNVLRYFLNLNLNLNQKKMLLTHFYYCDEKINGDIKYRNSSYYNGLFYSTSKILEEINQFGLQINGYNNDIIIKEAVNQFLFLIAHKNNSLKLFLEKNTIDEKIIDSCTNTNNPDNIKVKDRILHCINNKDITLDLSGLGLLGFPSIDIKELNHIQVLNLNNNKIIQINDETFNQLTNLQQLDLSYNRIIDVRQTHFNQLANLQQLDLSHNKIEEIRTETFDQLTNLRILGLDNHLKENQAFNENTKNALNLHSTLYYWLEQLNLKDLTVEQKNNLLEYLEDLDQKLNQSYTNEENVITDEELSEKTIKIFKNLNLNKTEDEIIEDKNQFLSIINNSDINSLIDYKTEMRFIRKSIESDLSLSKIKQSLDIAKSRMSKWCLFGRTEKENNIDLINLALENKINGIDENIYTHNPQIDKILWLIKTDSSISQLMYEIGNYLNIHRNKFSIFSYNTKSYDNFINTFFSNNLKDWKNSTESMEQKEARLKAINIIIRAYKTNSTELDLSNLGLDSLPPNNVFIYLPNITCLKLNDNQIKAIKIRKYKKFTNLKIIELNNNQIIKV